MICKYFSHSVHWCFTQMITVVIYYYVLRISVMIVLMYFFTVILSHFLNLSSFYMFSKVILLIFFFFFNEIYTFGIHNDHIGQREFAPVHIKSCVFPFPHFPPPLSAPSPPYLPKLCSYVFVLVSFTSISLLSIPLLFCSPSDSNIFFLHYSICQETMQHLNMCVQFISFKSMVSKCMHLPRSISNLFLFMA